MHDLFDAESRRSLLERLDKLAVDSVAGWGKMAVAQMLAHCTAALQVAAGDQPREQKLLGRLLAPLVRKRYLGEAPFPRNSPTDPSFVFADLRDFDVEKARLLAAIDRFVTRGPAIAGQSIHSFFGRLSGEEWGRLMGKHLDHHLRQFGV